MTAFTTRMPAGFAGQISRDVSSYVVEAQLLDTSNVPIAFGVPVKTVSGKLQGIQNGDAATVITGILVRSYPRQSTGNAFGAPTPSGGVVGNRLRRGYFMGASAYGTPALDGAVYVRVDTGGHGGTIGQLEATSDTTHSVAVPGARWMGPPDANGVAEIAYNV